MPKKIAVIAYDKCNPEICENGICLAVDVCKHKVMKQEKPFEKPDPPLICVGCGICVQACSKGAVVLI